MDRRAGVSPAPTWPHSSSSPPAAPILLDARTDTALRHLPGVPTVSQILSALEAEYTELKFLPTQAAGGANYLKSVRFTDLIGTLLPDRRTLHHQRRPVFGPAECRLAAISPGTRVFVAGGPRIAGRLPNPALFERRRDAQVAYRVLAGAVARSCVASLLLTSCAAVNVNPRASRPPCRPGIAAAQGGNG